jgi:hypothetical protein
LLNNSPQGESSSVNELLLWAALALAVLNAGLLIWIVLQRGGAQDQAEVDRLSQETAHQALLALVANSSERLERERKIWPRFSKRWCSKAHRPRARKTAR